VVRVGGGTCLKVAAGECFVVTDTKDQATNIKALAGKL